MNTNEKREQKNSHEVCRACEDEKQKSWARWPIVHVFGIHMYNVGFSASKTQPKWTGEKFFLSV